MWLLIGMLGFRLDSESFIHFNLVESSLPLFHVYEYRFIISVVEKSQNVGGTCFSHWPSHIQNKPRSTELVCEIFRTQHEKYWGTQETESDVIHVCVLREKYIVKSVLSLEMVFPWNVRKCGNHYWKYCCNIQEKGRGVALCSTKTNVPQELKTR